MLQKLLPIIVIAAAGIAGGGGGFVAKSMLSGKAPKGDAAAHGETENGHGKKKEAKGGHGGGHGEETATGSSYMKFGRQFVVPVVHNGRPKSMVILDINIVVDGAYGEGMYALEPRLRDAFLSRLLQLSGEGMLPQMLEDIEKLQYTKSALLDESRKIMGEAALDVLILDLGIQNY